MSVTGTLVGAYIDPASVTKDKMEARFRCKVFHSANQGTTHNTLFTMAFDSEEFDSGGLHDNATNNSRITIPTGGDTGVWKFDAQVTWASNATSARAVAIYKNGGRIALSQIQAVNGASTVMNCGVTDVAAVGDYYEVGVTQLSGGALNADGGFSSVSHFAALHLW